MHYLIVALLLSVLAPQSTTKQSREQRSADDVHLAAYVSSGGKAYWHDSKKGSAPDGTEVMVRRTNQPELRVSTKPIFKMKGVSKLILLGVDFTDAELAGISNMAELPALLINGKITDDGLKHLEGLSKLKKLWIYQTQVTGLGIKHLKNIDSLEYLYIDSELSVEGIEHLKKLTHVKQMWLPDFPEDRIKMLKNALPNTKIFN